MASGSTKAAQLSYLDTLDASSRTRYLKKIDVIGGQDPYKLGSDKVSADAKTLPAISYPDIVNYLVYSPSPYTLEDWGGTRHLEWNPSKFQGIFLQSRITRANCKILF